MKKIKCPKCNSDNVKIREYEHANYRSFECGKCSTGGFVGEGRKESMLMDIGRDIREVEEEGGGCI